MVIDGSKIEITPTNPTELMEVGLNFDITKWLNIASNIKERVRVLENLSQDKRVNLIQNGKPAYSIEPPYNAISSLDSNFLSHIFAQMKEVIWGKGIDRETGFQDIAGPANSELLCWDELGFIDYPNFDMDREGWESAYVYIFDNESISVKELSIEEMKQKLLTNEEGSDSIASRLTSRKINWKRLHNLPYCKKQLRKAKAILDLKQKVKDEYYESSRNKETKD